MIDRLAQCIAPYVCCLGDSEKTVLGIFQDWAKRIVQHCTVDGVDFQIVVSEVTDNPSVRLDIETSKAVARITCWESGDYYAEILDFESEKTIYESHGQLELSSFASSPFEYFFEILEVKI